MFINKIVNDIYETRYIASWVRAGGRFGVNGEGYYEFRKWLESLGLSDNDVEHIVFLAMNGKMELERSAARFIKETIL